MREEAESNIIAEIWERQRKSTALAREGLTLERIVDAVVELAQERSVAEISMARIAREIGFSPMALYRHVPNKATMMEIAVDRVVGPPPAILYEVSDWREGVMLFARELGHRYRSHQWIFDVRVSGPPTLPNSVRWMEAGLRIFQSTSLAPDEQMALLSVLTGFVRGNEQMFAEIMQTAPGEDAPLYGQTLAQLISPAEFPALWKVIESGVLDDADGPTAEDEHEFEMVFGLERIVTGIETMIARRTGDYSES